MKQIATLRTDTAEFRVMLKCDDIDTREDAISRAVRRAYGTSAYVGGGLHAPASGGIKELTVCGPGGAVIGRASVALL